MEEPKRKAEVKAKVYEYIKKQGGVSYAEIERYFEELGYNYKGENVCCSSVNPNVVFWEGWHKQAYSILTELLQEKKISREPAPWWGYLVDGKGLSLPVLPDFPSLKELTKVKREYWLPCLFSAA